MSNSIFFKHLFRFFLLTFPLFMTTSGLLAQSVSWTKYETNNGKASIKFPSAYTVESSELDNGTAFKISSNLGENIFFFGYSIHSVPLKNEELYDLAQISLDAFAEETGSEILNQEDHYVNRKRGIKAWLKMTDYDMKMDYYVVLADQTQYQVIFISSDYENSSKLGKKFLKSFKIK